MKNKIALASAFVAASSLATAEIVINDFLSFEGFIDMSYQHSDIDSDIVALGGNGIGDSFGGSDNSFQVDQVEIDWLFDFDTVTAQIDLAYYGSDAAGNAGFENEGDVIVEQAFATYHFDNGGAITAGRFASMLGFEAFEPTGLYQFSFAYDYSILPGYSEGVKFTHESDDTFFGLSLLSSYADDQGYAGRLGGSGDSNWAAEIAGAYYMDNGLGFFLGGYYQDSDTETGSTLTEGDTYAINAYVTFETGAWIFAAEINYGEDETGAYSLDFNDDGTDDVASGEDGEALSGLLMANYAYSEKGSITGRASYEEIDFGNAAGDEGEQYKLTLAHGYAFTDNLSLVTEVSYVDGNLEDDNTYDEDYDGLIGAVEVIFAF